MKIHIPYHGEQRFVKRFAIFPIKVCHEIVWLETVYLLQEWRPDITVRGWYNYKLLDKETYEKLTK